MSKSLQLIVEALLFASDKPLSIKDIRVCLPEAKPAEIKEALEALESEYLNMHRSFHLRQVADAYQLRTRSEYSSFIQKMFEASPTRLSRAAMETLSIIAYKQPILRQEIERFRGVDVGGILRTLLEKGLIKIMGRKDLPGRPLIYGTTNKFLEVFDLKDLESLPKLKEIKAFGSDEDEGETQIAEAESYEEESPREGEAETEDAPQESTPETPQPGERGDSPTHHEPHGGDTTTDQDQPGTLHGRPDLETKSG
jgi:segregation and condensation protein B